jgi:hypothetical protein
MLVSLTVSVAPGLIKNPIPDRTQASYPELAHWFPLDFSLELAFVGWEPVQSDQVYLRSSLGLDPFDTVFFAAYRIDFQTNLPCVD